MRAGRVGFEPTVPFPVRRFSRPDHSTTLTPAPEPARAGVPAWRKFASGVHLRYRVLRHAARIALLLLAGACSGGRPGPERAGDSSATAGQVGAARVLPTPASDSGDSIEAMAYEGVDSRGIPHYYGGELAAGDSGLLRRAYGIEDPHRLYVSDSTEEGLLKYDTHRKRCRTCYVNSYRVGFVSVRHPGESWEAAERRVRGSPPRTFVDSTHSSSAALADLDPAVQPHAEAMLRAGRAAGFRLRVVATYRSPLREAFYMAEGHGRTHTLTSNHSYGRALDVTVDDGNRAHARTRRDWVAFRRWLTAYRTTTGESFRLLGSVDRTWDWAHVELPSSEIGFGTVEAAVARARACLGPQATIACDFAPHLPDRLRHALVR